MSTSTDDNWLQALLNTNVGLDYQDWRAAIVIAREGGSARIGFSDGQTATMDAGAAAMPVRGKGGTAFAAIKAGDIIAVAPESGSTTRFALRAIPKISGGFIAEEQSTGRVLAMQGGFDARHPGVQPRGAGRAPDRIDDQADRLFRRARRRHDPRDDPGGRAVLRRSGRTAGAEMLQEFRQRRLCRAAHDALGHRTVAQPDDGARRGDDRHAQGGRSDQGDGDRQLPALSFLCARRGRDDGRPPWSTPMPCLPTRGAATNRR